MTKEALKLALEALETCGDDEWHTDDDFGMMQTYDADKVNQAITAIKEALAQPQPRPWVGLTDDEIKTILSQVYCDINRMKLTLGEGPQKETVGLLFAKGIGQALKEKNT